MPALLLGDLENYTASHTELRVGPAQVRVVQTWIGLADPAPNPATTDAVVDIAKSWLGSVKQVLQDVPGAKAKLQLQGGRLDLTVVYTVPIEALRTPHTLDAAAELLFMRQTTAATPRTPGVLLRYSDDPSLQVAATGTGTWALVEPEIADGWAERILTVTAPSNVKIDVSEVDDAGKAVPAPVWVPGYPGLEAALKAAHVL